MDKVEYALSQRPANVSHNFSFYGDDPYYGKSPPLWVMQIFMPTFFSVVCVTGLIGNGIVIYILLKYASPKTVPNVFILNLAAADFLFLLGLPFITYTYTRRPWIFGNIVCKCVMGLDGMNMFTGIFTLTAMSVDRYLAIVRVVWSQNNRTLNKARLVCALLWLLSIAVTMPLWVYATVGRFDNNTIKCTVQWSEPLVKTFGVYSFFLGFALPIAIIILCYASILVSLARCPKTTSLKKRSQFGKVGILVLLAVALFIVCWLPFWISQLSLLSGSQSFAIQMLYLCSPCLTYANCCLNPLIYTYVRNDFRKYLKQACCFSFCLAFRRETSKRFSSRSGSTYESALSMKVATQL
ncbi:somatostatin receptor type 2-like [Ptychodera flava]|uniref:somatostatin receptor type 2-like n=1 Tax=Ptychodera flava TaxID=63121 RepID=UPI00396A3C06